jgi:hydrogenase maturation factor HypF (carbamoyltransferase family)
MATIDIDVNCGNCGNRLHTVIDTNSKGTFMEVELCEDCEKEYTDEIGNLESQIENLESQIEELKETLENMEMFK